MNMLEELLADPNAEYAVMVGDSLDGMLYIKRDGLGFLFKGRGAELRCETVEQVRKILANIATRGTPT